jgi:lipopolysaccharide/colanic/teichoic acid biosynthesis glycosyltransferase
VSTTAPQVREEIPQAIGSAAGSARRDVRIELACRCADVLVASVLLLLLAPLLLAIIVAVRIDTPGPALFRQRRLGHGRRPFMVNKFRTMRPDADETVHRAYVRRLIDGEDEQVCDGHRSLYKLAVDDRVTRVGRFLRRTSLDELPQLWNVIRGDMSLVGPRPVIPYEAERYPVGWNTRFDVRPGITGLWQVNGRNQLSYEEMVELDLDFVRRHSFRLYLSILLRTVVVVATGRGAA